MYEEETSDHDHRGRRAGATSQRDGRNNATEARRKPRPRNFADIAEATRNRVERNARSLEETLCELRDVREYATEDGMPVPSPEACANAERILRQMHRISPGRYGVYPDTEGSINLDARGPNGGKVMVTCKPDGRAMCLAKMNGEPRSAWYGTTRSLPDRFIKEALQELRPDPMWL